MQVDSVVGIPIDCSGKFAGCERMPAALRAAGLDRLGVPDLGNLQVALADPRRDPVTGIIAYDDLVHATRVIEDAICEVLVAGHRPLVIGGCCSLLIGTATAVQKVHPGSALAFLDGHYDFYTGQTSPTGEAADMELALLLGHGPESLTRTTSRPSIQTPGEVVVIGPRDSDIAAADGAQNLAVTHPDIAGIWDAETIGEEGPQPSPETHSSHCLDPPGTAAFGCMLISTSSTQPHSPPSTTPWKEASTGRNSQHWSALLSTLPASSA